MQVLNNGNIGQVTTQAGNPVVVQLNEVEPGRQRNVRWTGDKRWLGALTVEGSLEKKSLGGCHCVWISE